TQAIAQMDEATQQNAALVEEAAAAAESLEDQTGALVQAVSVFKVRESSAVRGKTAVARAKAPSHPQPKAGVKSSAKGPKPALASKGPRPLPPNESDDQWEEF
ncbi:MAG: hypothetical protein N2202_10115, partial [Proteobacteria bacterium]|nr:hypothetical protein [Pseudomonadota bacterium]